VKTPLINHAAQSLKRGIGAASRCSFGGAKNAGDFPKPKSPKETQNQYFTIASGEGGKQLVNKPRSFLAAHDLIARWATVRNLRRVRGMIGIWLGGRGVCPRISEMTAKQVGRDGVKPRHKPPFAAVRPAVDIETKKEILAQVSGNIHITRRVVEKGQHASFAPPNDLLEGVVVTLLKPLHQGLVGFHRLFALRSFL
jgi:hypothetical protein